MAYEQKPNTFSLFKNDKKTKETHPDYKGTFVDFDGLEYFCDAWIKEGKSGKFMSGKVKLKDKQKTAAPVDNYKAPTTPAIDAMDNRDDIPF